MYAIEMYIIHVSLEVDIKRAEDIADNRSIEEN